MASRRVALVSYASPDLVPNNLRRVAVVMGSAPESVQRVSGTWVTSPDQAPADRPCYGAVSYTSLDLVPKGLLALALDGVDEALKSKLTMPSQVGRNVTLQYVDANTRYAYVPIVNSYWVRWTITALASGFWQTTTPTVVYALDSVDNPDPGITYTGVWDSFPTAGSLNGTSRRSQVTNEHLEFTVTGVRDVWLVNYTNTNCGYAYVTINGGTDLVNELPLDGGGHRWYDTYAASATAKVRTKVASGLNPASTYTVSLIHSGQKRAAASDHRVYFEGYSVDAEPSVALAASLGLVAVVQAFGTGAYEYACNYKPEGASAAEYTGSGHLNEAITAVTWRDGNGEDVVVSEGAPQVAVATLVLTNTGTSRHSETGATDHANVTSRATFDHTGVTFYHSHEWLTTPEVSMFFCGMFGSLVTATDRGIVAGDATPYDLSLDDNRWLGKKQTRCAAVWANGGNWVGWLWLPDLVGVNGWAIVGAANAIQDTAVNNKIYVSRVGTHIGGASVTPSISDVWESTHECHLSYLADTSILP